MTITPDSMVADANPEPLETVLKAVTCRATFKTVSCFQVSRYRFSGPLRT